MGTLESAKERCSLVWQLKFYQNVPSRLLGNFSLLVGVKEFDFPYKPVKMSPYQVFA
jgi:hypothetical protein